MGRWITVSALCALTACAGGAPAPGEPLPPQVLETGPFRHDQHLSLEEDGKPLGCASCHRVQAEAKFATVRPGSDEHAPCDRCHAQSYYQPPGPVCASCHTSVDPTRDKASPLKPFPRQQGRASLVSAFDHQSHIKRNKDRVAEGQLVCEACHLVADTDAAYASFPKHETCAYCHEKVATPKMGDCSTCHQQDGPTRGRKFLGNDIRFTHGKHKLDAAGKAIDCVLCHYEVVASSRAEDLNLPKMKDCAQCHENGERTPERVRIAHCGVCHQNDVNRVELPGSHTAGLAPRGLKVVQAERAVSPAPIRVEPVAPVRLELPLLVRTATSFAGLGSARALSLDQARPEDHTPLFRTRHQRAARAEDAKCAYCHTGLSASSRDSCQDCHAVTRPRDHALRWLSVAHGRSAAKDPKRCATCHEADTCTSCHQVAPQSHFPREVFKTRHYRSARANPSACMTCHSFETTCATCHGVALGAGRVASPLASRPAQLEAYSPFPGSARELEERLIVRAGAGYQPIFGGLTGAANTQGVPVAEGEYRTRALLLDGDLALGTRGIGLETLHTYFLGRAQWDTAGEAYLGDDRGVGAGERWSATTGLVHRYPQARQLLVQLGYAELEGLSTEGALSHVVLRAGRQFHAGVAAVSFDGGTLGWDDGWLAVLVRGGRRAAIYDRGQDDPGLLFGGTARLDLGARGGAPLLLQAELLHFQRTLGLDPRDQARTGAAEAAVKATAAELSAEYAASPRLLLWGRFSLVAPEPSHARAGAELGVGPALLVLELDQKLGRDLSYDLSTGPGEESGPRSSTLESLRLNIPDQRPYTDLSARVLVPLLDWLELEASPELRWYYGAAEARSPFDASRVSVGGGAHATFIAGEGGGLSADLEYSGIFYLRGNQALGTFRDDDAGAERTAHEGTLGVSYARGGRLVRRRMLGSQLLRVSVQAFARTATLDNRLIEPIPDSTFGGRASFGWSFTDHTRVELLYEYARDSRLFLPQLADFHALRGGLSASF